VRAIMAKKYILYLLLLFFIYSNPSISFGADSVKDQLKENGYSTVQDYFETRRVKKTTGVLPESGAKKKTL